LEEEDFNMANNQKSIDEICKYRDLPKLLKLYPCEVDGSKGFVFGGNSSANLNVKFENGQILNCHPYWRFKVWDFKGNLVYISSDLEEKK